MRRLFFLLVALPLIATGCSSGSSGAPPAATHTASSQHGATANSACTAGIVPTICVTARITGAVTVSGTAATTAPAPPDASPKTTCAQLAALNGSSERDLGGNVTGLGGHALAWDEDLGHFHGPGRYDLSRSDFHVNVDAAGFAAYNSTASVTVGSNFATTYRFTDLHSDSGTISGTLSWTCLDPT